MRNTLILLVFLGSLTACADRERHNCDTTKATGFLESKCP
jgi:hypothetical protein